MGIDLASAELVFAGPDIDLYQPRREPGSSRVDQISYRRCRPETPPGFADSDRGGCCRGYPDSSPDLLHADSPAEHVGTAVDRRDAVKVQQHIGRLPVRYYDANKTGSLVSRIMSDVEGVRNLIGTGLVDFVGGLFTAVIAFGLLVRINTVLTFLALGFLLVFGLILRKAFKSIRPIFRERGKINAEVTGRLTESLAGVRVVKGFHAEEREAAVFEAGAFRLFENVRRTLFATSMMGLASTLLMGYKRFTVSAKEENALALTVGAHIGPQSNPRQDHRRQDHEGIEIDQL